MVRLLIARARLQSPLLSKACLRLQWRENLSSQEYLCHTAISMRRQ
jgi:hypothetical protein